MKKDMQEPHRRTQQAPAAGAGPVSCLLPTNVLPSPECPPTPSSWPHPPLQMHHLEGHVTLSFHQVCAPSSSSSQLKFDDLKVLNLF
jgi:hypothetical protein